MTVRWTSLGLSFLNQLPRAEQSNVLKAVEALPTEWDSLGDDQLKPLAGDLEPLRSLRVGSDLRVLVRRDGSDVTVVDIVRKSQIDGLRHLMRIRETAAG